MAGPRHRARGVDGGLGEVLFEEVVELVVLRVHAALAAVLGAQDALKEGRDQSMREVFFGQGVCWI